MSACSYGKKSFKGSECDSSIYGSGRISKGSKVRSNISDRSSDFQEHSFTIREYN